MVAISVAVLNSDVIPIIWPLQQAGPLFTDLDKHFGINIPMFTSEGRLHTLYASYWVSFSSLIWEYYIIPHAKEVFLTLKQIDLNIIEYTISVLLTFIYYFVIGVC